MAGRKSELHWTKSRGQYTTTIDGVFYPLGTDKEEAERQFRFLLNKHDLGEPVDTNPTFAQVVDQWLDHVQKSHDPDRYRLCKARMEEFVRFVGEGRRVKDIRPRHVEGWIASKTGVTKPGTERNYKAMVLAALNWAASKKVRLIATNPLKGLIELPEADSRGGEVVWPRKVYETVLRLANPAFANVVRILAWTGARPSTVCKVEARHYIKHLRLWDVEDLYRGRKSKRKYVKRIWLPAQAVALVERLNGEHPTGPIFRNAQGTPWNPDALGIYLYQMQHKFKATRNLEWPEGFCLYGLRHTFATNFIKEHPDKLEYLRELLGHRDMQMIRRHYGHLFDEHSAIHGVLDSLDFPDERSAPDTSVRDGDVHRKRC
jgi:integrase